MSQKYTRFLFIFTLVGLLVAVPEGTAADPILPPPPAPPELPVIPTVPAPRPPAKHRIRYQDLISTQEPMPSGSTVGVIAAEEETGPELSLGECLAIAVQNQPSLKAVLASGSATSAGYKALSNFGTVGTLISPDLEIRTQQAQRGMAAATAEYQKTYNEVVQDVTRMYYTAVYAKQQGAIAESVIEELKVLIKTANQILADAVDPAELGGLTKGKILAMEYGLKEVEKQLAKARIGRRRALAALSEAMGVDHRTFPFRPKDKALPVMSQKENITEDLVVDLALGRRPELALAAAGLDAFRLEVYAQGKIPFRRVVPTFASGSDIHAKALPSAVRTATEYRPGAIIPELPVQLVGSKYDRVCRAMAYAQKAEAMFEKVRNLIALEAANGYYEFQLASENLRLLKEALDKALEAQDLARKSGPDTKDKSIIVQAEVLAAKAQADYVEGVFQHLLALSELERLTAGGIRPAFPDR